jgi:Fe-Mn family superoxide dismutase
MNEDRRSFLASATATAAAVIATATKGAAQTTAAPNQRKVMPIELPKLPFEDNALAPTISSNTISFHYAKHHKTYVDNLNKAIAGTDLAEKPLVEIVRASAGKADKVAIFNNSAQVWNHTFYWNSLSPKSTAPSKDLADRIEKDLGGMAKFKEQFAAAAMGQFGSGWAWLVQDGGVLKVTKTPNAETPITTSAKPLLTLDVWEHAYYLDYQNKRADYVAAVLDKLLNWEFASKNLAE